MVLLAEMRTRRGFTGIALTNDDQDVVTTRRIFLHESGMTYEGYFRMKSKMYLETDKREMEKKT
jgi:hypothetical protein